MERAYETGRSQQTLSIPLAILEAYESWDLCDGAHKIDDVWHYDDSDLKIISKIITLCNSGFALEKVKEYMNLEKRGKCCKCACTKMLKEKREDTLDEIHTREKWLDCLDFLQHEIQQDE